MRRSMIKKLMAGLLMTGVMFVSTACEIEDLDPNCTAMGCGAAFRVDFASSSWPAGEYQIDVTEDGQETSCTVVLPFASCEGQPSCTSATPDFYVLRSGCALSTDQHKLLGVEWPTASPAQISIELSRDGVSLGSDSYQPTYHVSHPNGPDCEPVCTQSNESGTLAL